MGQKIIERKDARANGLKRYCTGRSCKNGHKAERYTASGVCVECLRMHQDRGREQKAEAKRMLQQGDLPKAKAIELESAVYCTGELLDCGHGSPQLVVNDRCWLCVQQEQVNQKLDLDHPLLS